jgi:hypothetical protein
MADETISPEVAEQENGGGEARALAIGIAGWLVPGLGHAFLKMWGRAVVVFFDRGSAGGGGDGNARKCFHVERERCVRRAGISGGFGYGMFLFCGENVGEPGTGRVARAG